MYQLNRGCNYSYFQVPDNSVNINLNYYVPSDQVFDYSNKYLLESELERISDIPVKKAPKYNEIVDYNGTFLHSSTSAKNASNKHPSLPQSSAIETIIDLTDEDNNIPIFWDPKLYKHTVSRTLDRNRFVSPATLIGKTSYTYGHYNYSYFNNQGKEDMEIIDHSTQKAANKSRANDDSRLGQENSRPKKDSSRFNKDKPHHSGSQKHSTFSHDKSRSGRENMRAFASTDVNTERKKSPQKLIVPIEKVEGKTIHINDIFKRPKSKKCVVILRGLPGSGKSGFCQSFKEKEIQIGHSAPRILSLDHFFMEDGKFEYDAKLESRYREELFKSFKRQINEGYFSMIILDSINEKVSHFAPFYNYADMNLFEVCILEMKASSSICAKRSEKKYDSVEVFRMAQSWEEIPAHFTRLDAASFLQDASIQDVEMEDAGEDNNCMETDSDNDDDDEDEITASGFFKSKWDEDFEDTKDRLDGMKSVGHEHSTINIRDYLQSEMDLLNTYSQPDDKNKKNRVKWADFEELKRHEKRKQLGFVAGATDWTKLMASDIEVAEQALVQVRYYDKDTAI